MWEAGTAVEVPTQWTPDLWTLHASLDHAILQLDEQVEIIKQMLEADTVVMCLSDYEKPWRRSVMPTYKASRKTVRKPVVYGPLRQYIHEKYETFQRPGLEGDDCLGILSTNPNLFSGRKIIVSIDKDMKTLPGQYLNLKAAREHGAWFPKTSTEAEADYHHMLQAVMGDSTDGYAGCPGIGAVTAAKLLAPFCIYDNSPCDHKRAACSDIGCAGPGCMDLFDGKGAWLAIVAAYAKKGLSKEVALQNARVARICRHTDYDYSNKTVKLWQAPV